MDKLELVAAKQAEILKGGAEKYHLSNEAKGKLFARERIEYLVDDGSLIEDGLFAIDFYKARKPEAVMRTFRTVISRAEPDLREARLLAALGYEIKNYMDRHGFSSSETSD